MCMDGTDGWNVQNKKEGRGTEKIIADLPDFVRRGYLNELKKIIPPNLFVETNLPPILVTSVSKTRCPHGTQWVHTFEDAPLALSMYIPGRPLYRVDTTLGTLVPFKLAGSLQSVSSDVSSSITCIDKYYELGYDKAFDTITKKPHLYLPDEYRYFLGKVLSGRNPKAHLVTTIKLESFRCPGSLIGSKTGSRLHGYHWFIKVVPKTMYMLNYSEPEIRTVYVVTEKSRSHGRYYNIQLEMQQPEKLETASSILQAKVERNTATKALRMLYAVDYTVYARRYLKARVTHHPQSPQRIDTAVFEGSKVLVRCGEQAEPVVIGYMIRDADFVKIEYENQVVVKFARNLINTAKKFEWTWKSEFRDEDDFFNYLRSLYTSTSVNSVLVNALKFVLTSDLYTSSLLREQFSAGQLINAAITYADMYSTFTKTLHNSKCTGVASHVLTVIKEFLQASARGEPHAILTKLFISGKRAVLKHPRKQSSQNVGSSIDMREVLLDAIQKTKWDEIKERLETYVCYDEKDPLASLLISTLVHTINHHIIRQVSIRSRVPASYISETFDIPTFDPQQRQRASHAWTSTIMENVSGGVGAIDSSFKVWNNSDIVVEGFKDILVNLGSCLVGTPDDLVYYTMIYTMLYKRESYDKAKEYLSHVASRLGIVISNEELREAEKVCDTLVSEVRKIAKIAGNASVLGEHKLLEDVIKLRLDCELSLGRSCSPDELALFFVKNLSSYPALRNILLVLLTKLLDRKKQYKSALIELYSPQAIAQTRDLANRVLQDLHDMANGGKNALYGELNNKEDLVNLVVDVAGMIKSVLLKLTLKSCEDACGFCYVNIHSCRFSSQLAQKSLLSRRLAKLYAMYLLNSGGWLRDTPPDDYRKVLGRLPTPEGSKYIVIPWAE